MLRRTLTVALAVATICTTPLIAGAAERVSPRERQCRFQWMDKEIWTSREEWRTAKCVTEKWSIPGGMTKLQEVGSCESGWNRLAYNSGGPYVGVFQHALSAWTYRVDSYEPYYWDIAEDWRNTRSQITVTVLMVRAVGWGPWTCA